MSGRLVAAVVVAVVAAAAGFDAFSSHAHRSAAVSLEEAAAALPPPSVSTLHVPRPTTLRATGGTTWAPVRRRVVARVAPSAQARAVGVVGSRTPEGTANIAVVTRVAVRGGRLWDRLALPVLPNDTEGWVPRSALGGYTVVDTRFVVRLQALRATLYRNGRAILRVPVGVGLRSSPTPTGTFYIRNKLTRYASAFYGPVAFGTSARSEVLTDWPAGGFIGIHGTNHPELIPGRISHGCIRLRNKDILRLNRLLPIGSPVVIRD